MYSPGSVSNARLATTRRGAGLLLTCLVMHFETRQPIYVRKLSLSISICLIFQTNILYFQQFYAENVVISQQSARVGGWRPLATGEQVPDDVHCDSRVFPQPAHRIGMPALAERHINPEWMSACDQPGAQCAGDAQQHLELIT